MTTKLVFSVLAALLTGAGLFVSYRAIEVIGTPWWGYADNAPGVYFLLGSVYLLAGLAILLLAATCVRAARSVP